MLRVSQKQQVRSYNIYAEVMVYTHAGPMFINSVCISMLHKLQVTIHECFNYCHVLCEFLKKTGLGIIYIPSGICDLKK